MRVLGIDCGTERTGLGVIDTDGRAHRLVTYTTVRTKAADALDQRLLQIVQELRRMIASHEPGCAAVEEVFHSVNSRTAIKLAHVRGAVLFTIAEAGLPLGEYAPTVIKGSVVGYGRAEKCQVQAMVQSILKLPEPITSPDAADAVAIAICHATHLRLQPPRLVARGASVLCGCAVLPYCFCVLSDFRQRNHGSFSPRASPVARQLT